LATKPSRGPSTTRNRMTREGADASPRRGRPPAKAASKEPVRQGPRRRRDGDATRARILDVAIREFASNGFNGARVDAICRNAQVNPRMIYHYFGDKAGLYVSVLEEVLGELRREELKLEVDHVEPLEGILSLFHFIHKHFGRHEELISLLSGENLLEARFLRRSTDAPIKASPLIALIAGLLRRGEQSGTFRSGIDPLVLYVAMASLSYFHRSNVHTLSSIFQHNLKAPAWQAAQRRLAEDMISRVLLRDPGP
jgi:AcrR family transcriptional regulator